MRLLTALVALGQGRYTLTGTERMKKRPIRDLIEGLHQLGIKGRSVNGNGCPPVQIIAQPVGGGRIHLNCSVSSQYLSALLLIAPYARQGIEIRVSQGPVSRPYVDITLDVMQKFGVGVERCNYEWFNVRGSQRYHAGEYFVEPDCSQAGYFWAAAAITGAGIKVKDVWPESCQGDIGFIELLEIMGCRVYRESDGITVTGDSLSAVEADMADLPDMVPTLAVVAAFAKGTTVIRNVAHLKVKESDRLAALRNELARVGIETRLDDGNLLIRGGRPHGAQIKTYGDHRIAMSFALVGLKTAGIVIEDETCVEKSFPNFWQVLEKLYDCD
jgi:3-phosphoshikimate 1-carboxyvinyltransferase